MGIISSNIIKYNRKFFEINKKLTKIVVCDRMPLMKNKKLLLGLTILSVLGGGVLYYSQNRSANQMSPKQDPQKIQSEPQIPSDVFAVLDETLKEIRIAQREVSDIIRSLPDLKGLEGKNIDSFDTLVAEGTDRELLRISLIPHPVDGKQEKPYRFQLMLPTVHKMPEVTKMITLDRDGLCEIWLKDKSTICTDLLHREPLNVSVQKGQDTYRFINKISPETHRPVLSVSRNGEEKLYSRTIPVSGNRTKVVQGLRELSRSL